MVKTASAMVQLGMQAPDFSLLDVISNKTISLRKHQGKHATVIMFICNHCPYVKHIAQALSTLAQDYIPQGVEFIAINSNDAQQYPDDSPQNMKKMAQELAYPFSYLVDQTQEVAKAYHATCTPDFFVFNQNLELVYRGQFDASRPGNHVPVTGQCIRRALDCVIKKEHLSDEQYPSLGCNIKWVV